MRERQPIHSIACPCLSKLSLKKLKIKKCLYKKCDEKVIYKAVKFKLTIDNVNHLASYVLYSCVTNWFYPNLGIDIQPLSNDNQTLCPMHLKYKRCQGLNLQLVGMTEPM